MWSVVYGSRLGSKKSEWSTCRRDIFFETHISDSFDPSVRRHRVSIYGLKDHPEWYSTLLYTQKKKKREDKDKDTDQKKVVFLRTVNIKLVYNHRYS